MDDARFDRLARLLARATGRRVLLAAVALAGSAVTHDAAARRKRRKHQQKHCLHHGRRCGKQRGGKGGACKRCCSRFSLATSNELRPTGERRCACRPDGMACTKGSQCCNSVCNPATNTCDDGVPPAGEPVVCETSVNFCQQGAQNCGGSGNCYCVSTNQGDEFCTNGNYTCSPIYANVTCHDDTDCYNDYGEDFACITMSSCPSTVPCSGSGGTACAQICGS